LKTLRTRILPLLFCIAVGTALSWVCIYAFWFAVWTFHSVPIARACDGVGQLILTPGKWVYQLLGGDQSTIFLDPTSFSGTNGLILGILFYSVFRAVLSRRVPEATPAQKPAGERRVAAKVG
jgi:hypothetical protein